MIFDFLLSQDQGAYIFSPPYSDVIRALPRDG